MPLILIVLVAIIFFSVVLFMALTIQRRRATLYQWDTGSLRSCVTFKPLLGHSFDPQQRNPTDVLELLSQSLQQHITLDGVFNHNHHRKLVLNHQGHAFELSVHKLDKFPEEWVLRIKQRFNHGNSAPHDTQNTRAFLGLLQERLHTMPIGTVRWHKLQDFDRGQIDLWSYQPY